MKIFLVFLSVLAYGWAKSIFEDVPHIEHLTKENFDTVLTSDKVWLVEFFDAKNEKSKQSVKELEKTARILAGIAKIGIVDAAEDKTLAHDYDAKETPTIILFGYDKKKPTLYKDEISSLQLIKKVGAQVKTLVRAREEKEPNPKKDVIKLTADNFEKKVLESDGIWFVKYYDPNCAHSKAFAPEYAKAASALKGAVHVGAINMDVEPYDKLGEPYKIDKVPFVKVFAGDKVMPGDYDDLVAGGRTSTGLIDRALVELEKLVKNRLDQEKPADLYEFAEDSGEKKDDKKVKKEKEEKKEKVDKKEKDKKKDKKADKKDTKEEL